MRSLLRFDPNDDTHIIMYRELIQQLTLSECNITMANETTDEIYFLIDDDENRAIATCRIYFEDVHRFSPYNHVAHIEDVVVNEEVRQCGVGKELLSLILEHIRQHTLHVYKIILNCKDPLIPFYQACGFQRAQVQMEIRTCARVVKKKS